MELKTLRVHLKAKRWNGAGLVELEVWFSFLLPSLLPAGCKVKQRNDTFRGCGRRGRVESDDRCATRCSGHARGSPSSQIVEPEVDHLGLPIYH